MDERGATDGGGANGDGGAGSDAGTADPDPDPDSDSPEGGDGGRREVVVPLRLYKTVTVFSTLLAVVAVVFGFTLLDAATLQMSILRRLIVAGLTAVGLAPASKLLSASLAVLGLAVIGLGAGVYMLGTRFRARQMGNAQEDGNEGSTDG
ncbi:MAG: hypothetical protein ABEJ81_02545 [Haloferacaceae archaeon]